MKMNRQVHFFRLCEPELDFNFLAIVDVGYSAGHWSLNLGRYCCIAVSPNSSMIASELISLKMPWLLTGLQGRLGPSGADF